MFFEAIESLHGEYQRTGVGRLPFPVTSLESEVLTPPEWVDAFVEHGSREDNLAAAGRTEEAVKWFLNAAEVDEEGETDAAERAFELTEDVQDAGDQAGDE